MATIDELLTLNGIDEYTPNYPINPKPTVIEISREDFDLLEVEDDVTYHIIEEDGTITIRKGANV